jgi:hypothetical protein
MSMNDISDGRCLKGCGKLMVLFRRRVGNRSGYITGFLKTVHVKGSKDE